MKLFDWFVFDLLTVFVAIIVPLNCLLCILNVLVATTACDAALQDI